MCGGASAWTPAFDMPWGMLLLVSGALLGRYVCYTLGCTDCPVPVLNPLFITVLESRDDGERLAAESWQMYLHGMFLGEHVKVDLPSMCGRCAAVKCVALPCASWVDSVLVAADNVVLQFAVTDRPDSTVRCVQSA